MAGFAFKIMHVFTKQRSKTLIIIQQCLTAKLRTVSLHQQIWTVKSIILQQGQDFDEVTLLKKIYYYII